MGSEAGPGEGPHGELVELSTRFAHGFLRWVDAGTGDGGTYSRLRALHALQGLGPAKMRTLADALGLSARNVTTLADALESEGLVRRVPHPTDRRVTLLELTAAGAERADECLGPRLTAIGRLFDELDPPARAALREALATLVAHLDGPCTAAGPPGPAGPPHAGV